MDEDVPYRVLLVDDDADVASVVVAILTDDGYAVSVLVDTSRDSILAAVGKQEPDCVLLDGSSQTEYGSFELGRCGIPGRPRPIDPHDHVQCARRRRARGSGGRVRASASR